MSKRIGDEEGRGVAPSLLIGPAYVTVSAREALHLTALALALNITVQQLEELGEEDEKKRADAVRRYP